MNQRQLPQVRALEQQGMGMVTNPMDPNTARALVLRSNAAALPNYRLLSNHAEALRILIEQDCLSRQQPAQLTVCTLADSPKYPGISHLHDQMLNNRNRQ